MFVVLKEDQEDEKEEDDEKDEDEWLERCKDFMMH